MSNMMLVLPCRINMKRPGSGSSEGGGLLAGLTSSSGSSSSGPAVLKPLAPPPSYSPGQV